jgi:hypothetical protein
MPKITEEHIGRRALYTGRSGNSLAGTITGVTGVSSAAFVDLKLDDSKREHFYVPEDAVVLVPDELAPLLGDGDGS